ncbi:P-type conjugative transfer protein TrbL [Brevundimonas sp. NPDC092305]|uniref:P-type conjugative transfer protein TrbL n=1 Tax=Brevundimonas sp. NPDC092305 TaxID=3363957 RepID=UPI003816EB3E
MTVGVETPNELMVVFSDTVSAGFDALQGPVNGVFGLMIALVVALTGIQWALSTNREVLASGFMKILLIGAFAWLINDWQRLSETLYAGFIELGLTAGGGSIGREEFLNPGAVLAQGWEIVKALGETPAPVDDPLDVIGNLTDALILGLAMIGIMLAFAVLALQIIVSLLEFKIVTLGGFVLLPFGIWNKSAFLAERPLGYVVSSGLKVLALAIVVSGARTIFDQLQPSANPDIYEALSILVAALLLAMLAVFIPNLASALVTGGPALGAGAAVTGALAVGGAGALAGAGLLAAGGAAARLAGPARAAAGAGSGRPTTPGPLMTPPTAGGRGPGPSTPSPSNDNPTPRGGGGGAAPANRASGSASLAEPAVAWTDTPAARPGSADGETPEMTTGLGPQRRPAATIAAEREAARRDFHRAASRTAGSAPGAGGQSPVLRAFFIANAGRGLLPSSETSGVLNPNLKTEES